MLYPNKNNNNNNNNNTKQAINSYFRLFRCIEFTFSLAYTVVCFVIVVVIVLFIVSCKHTLQDKL